MSYDLWAWAAPALDDAVLAEQAELEFEGAPSALIPSPALAELVRDVHERFPPLEGLSDEDVDRSPWSVSPDVSSGLAAFAMGFRSAATACPVIVTSALRLGLRVHDPQTGTTYSPDALIGGGRQMFWEPAGWGCAAVWRWGADASKPAQRRKLRLTLTAAHAAIVASNAAAFVQPVSANEVIASLSFADRAAARPPLAVEVSDGAVLIRYRRDDEAVVAGALGRAARTIASRPGSWYLVAGDEGRFA